MRDQERRVDRLELRVQAGTGGRVLYVAVETWADLDAIALERPVKVYVGVSPDDWDEDGDHDS